MSIQNSLIHFQENENSQGLNLALKMIFLLIIWIIGGAFGLLPYFCKRCRTSAKILGVSNAFSGGVFLGIGLFHLLPESVEQINDYYEKDPENFFRKMPFTYFLAFATYALILFIEKVAFDSHSLIEHDHGHGHFHGEPQDQPHTKEPPHHNHEKTDEILKQQLIPNEEHCHNGDDDEDDSDVEEEAIKGAISTKGKLASFLYLKNSTGRRDKILEKSSIILNRVSKSFHGQLSKEDYVFMVNPQNVHVDDKEDQAPNKDTKPIITEKPFIPTSNLTPYILMIALAFHGFFEGVAMGVQDNIKGTLFLAVAILSHKWAESFTLGISFTKANTVQKTFVWLIVIFSLFGPLGVGLGVILSQATNKLCEGILLAMSTGTFLYVAATEVIVEEFAITKYKYSKYFFFLLGGIFTAALAVIEKYTEGEEDKF